MSKKYFFSIIFIHLILNINSQSSSINKNDISITNKIDPFKKLNYKPIDCDEICSKFKKNCPQLYEEIIDYFHFYFCLRLPRRRFSCRNEYV